jgi:hypothetical protein
MQREMNPLDKARPCPFCKKNAAMDYESGFLQRPPFGGMKWYARPYCKFCKEAVGEMIEFVLADGFSVAPRVKAYAVKAWNGEKDE